METLLLLLFYVCVCWYMYGVYMYGMVYVDIHCVVMGDFQFYWNIL